MKDNLDIEKKYEEFKKSLICHLDEKWNPDIGSGKYFALYFFESGSGIINFNSKNISFVSPSCFCVNEKDILKGINLSKDYSLHTILFTPSIVNSQFNFENIYEDSEEFKASEMLDHYWLNPFIRRCGNYTGNLLLGPGTSHRLKKLLYNLSEELDNHSNSYWPCRSRSYLIEILNLINSLFQEPHQGETFSNLVDDRILNIIHYLNEQYHQKITIKDLSDKFLINRTSLSEEFLKACGMSVISYLTKLRLKIACILLNDTILPISEISKRVGFEDVSHFGRVFKKELKLTPSQFREQNNKIC